MGTWPFIAAPCRGIKPYCRGGEEGAEKGVQMTQRGRGMQAAGDAGSRSGRGAWEGGR